MDCRENKVLNPRTCIFVKECKRGFTRNNRFQCRKNKQTNKSKKLRTLLNNEKRVVKERTAILLKKRQQNAEERQAQEERLSQNKFVAEKRQQKLNESRARTRSIK